MSIAGESRAQEFLELLRGHSAAFDLQLVLGVTLVVHVVRRICENEIRGLNFHQPFDIAWNRSVAGQEPVVTKHPKIADRGGWRLLQFRDNVLIGQSLSRILLREQLREFLIVEANEIHIVFGVTKRFDLKSQHFFVPSGIEGQFVVSENKRATLVFRQTIDNNYRDFSHAELSSGKQSAVACDYDRITADEDRIDESELLHRSRNLRNLLVAMGAGVTHVGAQPIDGPDLDLQRMSHALGRL
ncbi:MAG TPA: hypothetical protein VGM43_05125 [Bryobacteraceae bacterium]